MYRLLSGLFCLLFATPLLALDPVVRAFLDSASRNQAAANSGWRVGLNGIQRNCVVLEWFVDSDQARPLLFVDGEGKVEVQRSVRASEVVSRSITLSNAAEFRFKPFASAEREDETPSVVVLRPGPQGAEAVSGVLEWGADHPSLLTYFQGAVAIQQTLASQELENALGIWRAHRELRPLSIRGSKPTAAIHLETLIVDLRAKDPRYFFLYRDQGTPHSQAALRVVDSQAIQSTPPSKGALPERLAPAWRASAVSQLTAAFLEVHSQGIQDRSRALQKFSQFLASHPVVATVHPSYIEMLLVAERLSSNHDAAIPLPPFTPSEFTDLRTLNAEQIRNPRRALFLVQPQLTSDFRFQTSARRTTSREIVDLELSPADLKVLLEVVAQSPTGRELLKRILPLMRSQSLSVDFLPSSSEGVFFSDAEKTWIKMRAGDSLGTLTGRLLFQLTLFASRPRFDLPTHRFALPTLRESYRLTARILRELIQRGPALEPFVAQYLRVPRDSELINQWGLEPSGVESERQGHETWLQRCSERLLGFENQTTG